MNEGQMLDPIVELWYLIAKLYFTIYFRIDKPVKLIQFVYLGGRDIKSQSDELLLKWSSPPSSNCSPAIGWFPSSWHPSHSRDGSLELFGIGLPWIKSVGRPCGHMDLVLYLWSCGVCGAFRFQIHWDVTQVTPKDKWTSQIRHWSQRLGIGISLSWQPYVKASFSEYLAGESGAS